MQNNSGFTINRPYPIENVLDSLIQLNELQAQSELRSQLTWHLHLELNELLLHITLSPYANYNAT